MERYIWDIEDLTRSGCNSLDAIAALLYIVQK